MPNRQRQKGDRFERALVKQLQANGIDARRVPLSGSAVGFTGDVQAVIAGEQVIIEAKSRKDGFKQLYQWLVDRDLLVVKADRHEPLVVLPLDCFIDLALLAQVSEAIREG